jgi:hypothetical protein
MSAALASGKEDLRRMFGLSRAGRGVKAMASVFSYDLPVRPSTIPGEHVSLSVTQLLALRHRDL